MDQVGLWWDALKANNVRTKMWLLRAGHDRSVRAAPRRVGRHAAPLVRPGALRRQQRHRRRAARDDRGRAGRLGQLRRLAHPGHAEHRRLPARRREPGRRGHARRHRRRRHRRHAHVPEHGRQLEREHADGHARGPADEPPRVPLAAADQGRLRLSGTAGAEPARRARHRGRATCRRSSPTSAPTTQIARRPATASTLDQPPRTCWGAARARTTPRARRSATPARTDRHRRSTTPATSRPASRSTRRHAVARHARHAGLPATATRYWYADAIGRSSRASSTTTASRCSRPSTSSRPATGSRSSSTANLYGPSARASSTGSRPNSVSRSRSTPRRARSRCRSSAARQRCTRRARSPTRRAPSAAPCRRRSR